MWSTTLKVVHKQAVHNKKVVHKIVRLGQALDQMDHMDRKIQR